MGIGVILLSLSAMGLVIVCTLGLTRDTRRHTPTPLLKEKESSCHYCNGVVQAEPVTLRCPNCKEEHLFHTDCGFGLKHKEVPPQCFGKLMEHESGHTVNMKYPNICAQCGLGRLHWSEWHCAENAALIVEKRFMERRKTR